MPASSATSPPAPMDLSADERREWIRIDDRLLLEYRLLTEPADAASFGHPAVTHDMIEAAVAKPTADLLARSGDVLVGSPILPWIMKVDWLLEVLLKAVASQHPESMAIARVTDVNISGGGIGFTAPRAFSAGDQLAIRVILPPFTPIQATAKVIRATAAGDHGGFTIATQFVDLAADDQDHIIRYIIQTQAERLRARRSSP
jgi:hypothetical protein